MKALTIYQPWASLIMASAKPYEFRGWSPRERGGAYAALIGQRIIIHASARRIRPAEMKYILDAMRTDDFAGLCLHLDKAKAVLDAAYAMSLCNDDGSGTWLQYGAALGTAVLGEPRNGIEIAEEFGVSRANDSERHAHANWGWPMLEVEVWDEPVPMRGLQGFWNWPTPEQAGW